jgi:SET and MYND domain-containing protein
MINSLTLSTPLSFEIGMTLDLLVSKANHSCDPNAIIVFDGAVLSFRSLKSISKGEEIFISYIDATLPRERRQHELLQRYFFSCQCSKCKKGNETCEDRFFVEPPPPELLQRVNLVFGIIERAKRLEPEPEEYYQYLMEAMKIPTAAKAFWPVNRQPWPQLRGLLEEAMVITQRWTQALSQFVFKYFYIDPFLYPVTWHPTRVLNKWMLYNIIDHVMILIVKGEVSDHALMPEEYINWHTVNWGLLNEVASNVELSHGPTHSVALGVKSKLEKTKVGITGMGFAPPALDSPAMTEEWAKLRRFAKTAEGQGRSSFH